MNREERLKLISSASVEHKGIKYPVAIRFDGTGRARVPFDVERNHKDEILYVLPGGVRATERQIRGMM